MWAGSAVCQAIVVRNRRWRLGTRFAPVAGGSRAASGGTPGGKVAAKLPAHIQGLVPGLSGYGLQLALELVADLLQLPQDLLPSRTCGGLEAVNELVPLLLELLQEGLHVPGHRLRRSLAGRNYPISIGCSPRRRRCIRKCRVIGPPNVSPPPRTAIGYSIQQIRPDRGQVRADRGCVRPDRRCVR